MDAFSFPLLRLEAQNQENVSPLPLIKSPPRSDAVWSCGRVPRFNPFSSYVSRDLATAYLVAVNLVVLLMYLVDFGHYSYLEERLNATVLGYLRNLGTSFQMVRETYPVGRSLLLLLTLAAVVAYGVRHGLERLGSAEAAAELPLLRMGVIYALTVVLVVLGLYGSLTHYPLRRSNAYFSTRTMVSARATNPVLFFFSTLGQSQQPYDLEAARRAYPVMPDHLRPDQPSAERLNFSRQLAPQGPMKNRLSVVMMSLDSFATHLTGVSGNPLDSTPHFDALCKHGILFKNYYTPIVGTARSVFTAITGLPDVDS